MRKGRNPGSERPRGGEGKRALPPGPSRPRKVPRACPLAGRGSRHPHSPARPSLERRALRRVPGTSLPPQLTAPPRPSQAFAASYLGHIILHLIQVSIFEGPHEFLVRHRGRLAQTRAGEAVRGQQHLHGARAAARRAGAPPPAGGRSLAACRRAVGRGGGS